MRAACAEHGVHVVLRKEHADAALAAIAMRQLHQLGPLARRHAGGRLVHQQQLRAPASAMASSTRLTSP